MLNTAFSHFKTSSFSSSSGNSPTQNKSPPEFLSVFFPILLKMVINLLLLAVLFAAGLFNLFFYLPTKKFCTWFQSFFHFQAKKDRLGVSESSEASPMEVQKDTQKWKEIEKVFATFDKNSDGKITKEELMESMKNMRISMKEKEVEEMVKKVDTDGDGLIDLEEFREVFEEMGGGERESGEEEREREGELREAFEVFDKDKDGLITVDELGLVLNCLGLKEGKKMENCREMIRKVDLDGDGMVNFDEFKRMMKGSGKLLFVC